MSISGCSSCGGGQLGYEVSIAMAKKSQDVAKMQGEAAVSLLQEAAQMAQQLASVEPHKGNVIDTRA